MFLSPTNPIRVGSLMIPSVEVCMIKIKIHKCLHDIWLDCLPFKALICQVSTPGCQGFGFPGPSCCFRRGRGERGEYIPLERLSSAEWFPWLVLSHRIMHFWDYFNIHFPVAEPKIADWFHWLASIWTVWNGYFSKNPYYFQPVSQSKWFLS